MNATYLLRTLLNSSADLTQMGNFTSLDDVNVSVQNMFGQQIKVLYGKVKPNELYVYDYEDFLCGLADVVLYDPETEQRILLTKVDR